MTISKAQYEDLMLIRGEWPKITRTLGGANRVALKETVVEPAGDSCLCIVCSTEGNFSIVNREAVLLELKATVEENYRKSIDFKARLETSGRAQSTVYVSDEDLKVIHDNIEIEDE